MNTAFRTIVRKAQVFFQDGSNVMSVIMVAGVVVAIVALLPLGALFQAPGASSASNSAPTIDVGAYEAIRSSLQAEQEQMLREGGVLGPAAGLERGAELVSPQPYSRERQDDLKEQWLERRNPVIDAYSVERIQQQESLKDAWLERGTRTNGAAAPVQRQEALKDQWLERR